MIETPTFDLRRYYAPLQVRDFASNQSSFCVFTHNAFIFCKPEITITSNQESHKKLALSANWMWELLWISFAAVVFQIR